MTARNQTRHGSPLHITSAWGLYKKSYRVIKKNIWLFGVLFIIPASLQMNSIFYTPTIGSDETNVWTRYSWGSSGFSTALPIIPWHILLISSIIGFLFLVFVGTATQIMSQDAQLRAVRRHPLAVGSLWLEARSLFWKMLGLYLVMTLYIVIGLILFIIPGLIMLRRYILAPYVMLDKKGSIKDAMDTSARMSSGEYAGSVYGIIGVMILISLINIIPYFGWMIALVIGLLYSAAPALRYEELRKIHTRTPHNSAITK